MKDAAQIVFGLAILALFIWLIIPTPNSQSKNSDPTGDPLIDPDDSYQIGLLMGLTGGSIPDATTMRFALQRFQQIHGRRAASRDMGIVLGLINLSK